MLRELSGLPLAHARRHERMHARRARAQTLAKALAGRVGKDDIMAPGRFSEKVG